MLADKRSDDSRAALGRCLTVPPRCPLLQSLPALALRAAALRSWGLPTPLRRGACWCTPLLPSGLQRRASPAPSARRRDPPLQRALLRRPGSLASCLAVLA
jgi:hypothetical protein